MNYKDLIEMGSTLSKFVVGTEGNISQRSTDGFIIKPSGKSLSYGSFIHCDDDGKASIHQTHRPSMESSFHAWIYKNSHHNFIAHTHPVNTLKILCSNDTHEFARWRLFPDQVVFNDATACVVPYATPGGKLTVAIEDATKQFIRLHGTFPSLFLLKNHGIICCAESAQQAIIMTEICEKAAEVFMGAKLLGSICILGKDHIEDIQTHDGETYRKAMQ